MRFHWVAEATISETVPQNRTSLSWLITRGLRIGAINYHVQRKATPTAWSRIRLGFKLLAALPLSLSYAVRAFLTERKRDHRHAPDDGGDRQRAGRDRYRTAALQSVEDRLVSQFVTTSEVRAVVGEIRRQQVMDIVRGADIRRNAAAGVGVAASVRRSRRHAGRRHRDRQRDDDLCGVRRPRGTDAWHWPCATTSRGLADVVVAAVRCCSRGWLLADGRAVVRSEHVDPARLA